MLKLRKTLLSKKKKNTIDVLSQEYGISDIVVSDQIIGLESDIQVHTPHRSKSNIRKRQVNQLKLEASNASLSDSELIFISLQHKGKQKNRHSNLKKNYFH